jgi:hypothetical protein
MVVGEPQVRVPRFLKLDHQFLGDRQAFPKVLLYLRPAQDLRCRLVVNLLLVMTKVGDDPYCSNIVVVCCVANTVNTGPQVLKQEIKGNPFYSRKRCRS